MINVVGVRFKNAGKVYYFDPGDMELSDGDKVIVETVRGLECGEVVGEPRLVPDEEVAQPLKKVIRKATPEDELVVDANREKERRAFKICLEKIAAHGLPMKLVDVEYTFDGSKIIFFFTADGRVDFRELVKDLAGVFRTRIELRQIGVRDEAKMIGGLGPCGRPLCCATFLRDFEPVSIRMAKDQNLSLNPTKISGICGRLMCCLKYEHEVYKTLRQALPPVGSEIDTEVGRGKITELDVLKGIACVKMEDGKIVHVDVRRQNGASRYPVVTSRWSGPCAPCVPCEEAGQLEATETETGTEPKAESEIEVETETAAQTATETRSETWAEMETGAGARGPQAAATAVGGTAGVAGAAGAVGGEVEAQVHEVDAPGVRGGAAAPPAGGQPEARARGQAQARGETGAQDRAAAEARANVHAKAQPRARAGAAVAPGVSDSADPRRRRGERGGRREGNERREGRDHRRGAAAPGYRAGDGREQPVPPSAHADVAAAAERAGTASASVEVGAVSAAGIARATSGQAANFVKPVSPRRRAARRRWRSGSRPGQETGRPRSPVAAGPDAAHPHPGPGSGGRAGREEDGGAVQSGGEAQSGGLARSGSADASSGAGVPGTPHRQDAAPGGEQDPRTAAGPKAGPGRGGSRVRRRGARRRRRTPTPPRQAGQAPDGARHASGSEQREDGKDV